MGEAQGAAAGFAVHDLAQRTREAAEEAACQGEIAFGDGRADRGRRDRLAVYFERGAGCDLEAKFAAEIPEVLWRALAVFAEGGVVAEQ